MGFCAQRDWIITHSRHAKSFSRFLLDIPRPIFSTQSPEAPIHPAQSSSLPTSSWAIKNQQNSLTLLSCHVSNSPNFVRFLISSRWLETKLWANCQDFLQKLNPIRAESQPELGLKKEIKIQRRQILHLHWGLLALENAAKCYRKPMQKYYFKETELYLCSFPSQIFFGMGQKIVFAFNQNRSWNKSTDFCMSQMEVGQMEESSPLDI